MGFASGFMAGAGAVNAYEDRKRRERLDARDDELHTQKMEDVARAKKDRDTLAQAGKSAATNESAATLDTGSGAKTYDMGAASSDIAASDARQFRRDTTNTTGVEPTLAQPQQAFTVNGQPVADRASMVKTAADYNAPQARNARMAQAYNDTGRPVEAMQLEASGRQAQAADMQIKAAEVAQARDAFNSTAQDTFRTAGVFNGAAKLLTDTNAGGLEGSKFEAAPSQDGKTMEFYRITPDGARVLHNAVPNSKEGELQVIQSFLKVSPDKIVDWYSDSLKRGLDERKTANSEKAEDTRAKAQAVNEKKIDAMIASMGGGFGRRGGSSGAGAGGDHQGAPAFNPMGTFDAKKAWATALEAAAAATDDAGQPLSPQAKGQLAQQTYQAAEDAQSNAAISRERARVFRVEAAQARTPEEIQAVQARALQSGYTPQEMAQIDARFLAGKPKIPEDEGATKAGTSYKPPKPPAATPAAPSLMAPTIEKMQHEAVKSFAPLATKVKQAEAVFIAAAKSGDQVAVARYMKEAQALRTQLEGAVNTKFGNAAPKVLQQLYAQ